MKYEERNGLRILTSEFGYLIHNKISDTYSSRVYLGKFASLDDFEEVDDNTLNFIIKREVRNLRGENLIQNELIDVSMLAMDEIFCLFEPLLTMTISSLSSENEVRNPMVELYVVMIQRGLKTIDQVPERYREDVKEILKAIEE